MRWDRISAVAYIVKISFPYSCFFYKILTHSVNVITVIDIRQFIYLFNSLFS